jgi:hypothetical protein
MYIGTLIEDFFQAVERAEKAVAKLPVGPETLEEAAIGGTSADQYQKRDSEAE